MYLLSGTYAEEDGDTPVFPFWKVPTFAAATFLRAHAAVTFVASSNSNAAAYVTASAAAAFATMTACWILLLPTLLLLL